MSPETAAFWKQNMGRDRVVVVTEPEFLAEVQAGLLYVTETAAPTLKGLVEFITAGGGNKAVSDTDAQMIWKWIVDAGVPFGAQTMLPGYEDIPMPGSVFAHYRHPWPIDHALAGENPELVDDGADLTKPTATEGDGKSGSTTPATPPKPIDWSKL